MKKLRIKTSLLVSAASIAGLAMGASIALAAHPPIQLFTYEEVSQQFQGPGMNYMPVMVGGNPGNAMQGMPYSPKMTCQGAPDPNNLPSMANGCHSDGNTAGLKPFSKLADHAFHSQMGENEWMDNDSASGGKFIDANGMQTGLNPQKPWLQSHGHNGKW